MKRRAFVQLAVSAVAFSPFERFAVAAADVLPPAARATLDALAPVVLPQELGRRGVGLVTERFVEWLRGYRPGVVLEHGYGRPSVRRTAEPFAARYVEQLAALEKTAAGGSQPFGRLPADDKRRAIEAALREAKVESLPDLPNGQHVVSDLMAFYFQGSAANDLCYRAQIGQETCRSIAWVTAKPRPLL